MALLIALLGGLITLLQAGVTQQLDIAVNLSLAPYRMPWLLELFLWITALGSDAALWSMMVVATAILWANSRPKLLVPLWVAFVGTEVTTWSLKFALDRPRPVFLADVASAISPSFPSAHSAGSMAVLGFGAFAATCFTIRFCTVLAIALIGVSRLFLNVHYLTDVIGGYLIGLLWLLIAAPRPLDHP